MLKVKLNNGWLKKLISKILSLFNLSLIREDKLIKLDVERKNIDMSMKN